MSKFFSFSVDKKGNLYFIQEKRCKDQTLNYDSHSYISERFELNDEEVWKYEIPIDIEAAAKWKKNPPPIDEVIEKWVKYDGGLPENEMPYDVFKSMKETLEHIIPHLYDWDLRLIELPEFIPDKARIITYDRELNSEDINALLSNDYYYSREDDCWKKDYSIVYNKVSKPTKKILVYTYIYKYAKLIDDKPIKINEFRTFIKDID